MDLACFAADTDKAAGHSSAACSIAADNTAETAAFAEPVVLEPDSWPAADIPAEDTAGDIAAVHHNRAAVASASGNSAAGIADTAPAACKAEDKIAEAYYCTAPSAAGPGAAHTLDARGVPAGLSA